jgi:hypothetical protein
MIKLELDLSAILDFDADLRPKMNAALQQAAQDLAAQTHAHILEQAQQKLNSTREKYTDALGFRQVNDSTWVVNLDADAMWIEQGLEAHEMIDNLLKSKKTKTAKDGCVLNPRNKVLTSLGWKPIKQVVAGDMVLTHSGKFREVKQLLVQDTPMGTEYVRLKINSTNRSGSHAQGILLTPSMTLTVDHLVLTPSGWRPAGDLRVGDLVASPADLKNVCKTCLAPLPINAVGVEFCLNNSCKRKWTYRHGGGLARMSPLERRRNSRKANRVAKAQGVFDRPDWGARNPKTLHKMRVASAKSMAAARHNGSWAPEECFSIALKEAGLQEGSDFVREHPIQTARTVNAGRGRQRKSTLFLDFFFPALGLIVELDGHRWHSSPVNQERDRAKDAAAAARGWRMERIPSHKIYRRASRLARHIKLWTKNHSGELGMAWVRIERVNRGVLNRKDHVFAHKYDICLDAEEHSFACETVFIHNSRYLAVPFQLNKGQTQQTRAGMDLTNTIRSELKQRKIPYGKIERDQSGRARLGLLHSFDITKMPVKTHEGPGQGKGPVGQVRQGMTGIPFLQGVRIFQHAAKGAGGKQKVSRHIMTFRIVSSKHKGTGRWQHPGLKARNFFDEAADWALSQWEQQIVPRILKDMADHL